MVQFMQKLVLNTKKKGRNLIPIQMYATIKKEKNAEKLSWCIPSVKYHYLNVNNLYFFQFAFILFRGLKGSIKVPIMRN